jgi:hypothetical protein
MKPINVEIYGWYVTIEVLDLSKRPNWEIRVKILRSKESRRESRGHRFFVPVDVAEKLKIDKWPDAKRQNLFAKGAKEVILREFEEIFSEPEGGLDSLRPLSEGDLSE